MRRLVTLILVGLALLAPSTGAQPRKARQTERYLNGIPPGDGPLLATLQTSAGKIVIRLYERETPRTVAHFVGLATGKREWRHPRTGEREIGRPLYDGTVVHRMIPNFMIQLGDPFSHPKDGDPARVGTGDPGFHVDDEIVPSLRFDRPALVALANTDLPNSAGCQFFITEVALPHLNGRHTVFGEVIDGFELVPKIARSALAQGRVNGPVTLERVLIARGHK